MSEAKFTGGPWKIYGDWGIQPADAKGDAKIFAEFSHDAECENTQEGFANAHLIAAAPEMYAMLEHELNMQKAEWGDDTEYPIETLLAKARGEHE